MNKTIFALFLSTLAVLAQPLVPATTTWSRNFLRSTNSSSSVTALTEPYITRFVTNVNVRLITNNVAITNLVVVDVTNGVNATATRTNLLKTSATISNALFIAHNGDVIYVKAGKYSEALRNTNSTAFNVSFYFEQGAYNTISIGANTPLFSWQTNSLYIDGFGSFTNTLGKFALWAPAGGTSYPSTDNYIKCINISAAGDALDNALGITTVNASYIHSGDITFDHMNAARNANVVINGPCTVDAANDFTVGDATKTFNNCTSVWGDSVTLQGNVVLNGGSLVANTPSVQGSANLILLGTTLTDTTPITTAAVVSGWYYMSNALYIASSSATNLLYLTPTILRVATPIQNFELVFTNQYQLKVP